MRAKALRTVDADWRGRMGNAAVVVALTALGFLFWRWQAEDFAWSNPGQDRWLTAAAVVIAYVAAVLAGTWRRRGNATLHDSGEDDASATLVVYASQTGYAERLAAQTTQALRSGGGLVRELAIADLDAETLRRAPRALFIAATTGEGDAPDGAARFMRSVMESALRLPALHFGLLALGDRDYRDYCAFGRQLDQWLHRSGAQPLFDRIDVDNGDAGALRHWQHHLRQLSGNSDLADWEAPVYQNWTLHRRRLLNAGSLGLGCFHLELIAPAGSPVIWQAGDIAEIGPRHCAAEITQCLTRLGLKGDTPVRHQGQTVLLSERLATSVLPTEGSVESAQALSDVLAALPHREYSIASLPTEGAVHLLVRQMLRPDGQLGLGSGWLTEHAPAGSSIDLRIRRNAAFHPPADARPLLLIGNGTGIAGLRALLKARMAAGHRRNWLIFGERQAAHDHFYAEDIAHWHAQGWIEKLDLVWSRDGARREYVQDRLRERADGVRDWLTADAAVYVCGSLDGMAPGVDAALNEILGSSRVDELGASGNCRRDVY